MDEKDLIPLIKKEEKKRAYSRLAQSVIDKGEVAPMPYLLLREFRRPIRMVFGAVIGLSMGLFSVIFVFLLVVYIMHMEF